jgi:hypothetical protein
MHLIQFETVTLQVFRGLAWQTRMQGIWTKRHPIS